MTVTALEGPRDWGQDIMDVILASASLKEKKAYRKLQEKQLNMAREELGLSERRVGLEADRLGLSREAFEQGTIEFAAELKEKKKGRRQYGTLMGRQLDISKSKLTISEAEEARAAGIYKVGAVERKGRRRLVKRFGRADKALATAKREHAVANTLGNKERIADTKAKLYAVRALHGKSAEMFETILFADEIAKDSRAQLYLAQQQALTANQTVELMDRNFRFEMQQLSNKYSAVASAITPDNLPAGIAAMDAIKAGDSEMLSKMHSSMMATTAAKKREPEERKFTPSKLNAEVVAEFGSGTYQQMLVAEASNLPYPDVRSVYGTGGIFGREWRKILTREEARAKGAEDDWMKATPIDLERMGDRIQPKRETKPAKISSALGMGTMPTKKKTVKEIVSEKAKKVKPAGTKTTERHTGEKVRVVSPDGTTGWIPREQLEDALMQGYKQIE